MVCFATFGSLGDLHPFIAVGRALQTHGIDARIATADEYRDAVESAGLQFATMRPNLATLGDPEVVSRRLFDPLRGTERMLREMVLPHLRAAHADLTRAAEGADLLVSHSLTYAQQIVAEQQHKPWISAVLAPVSLLSRADPPVLPGIDALRIAQRLGPVAYDLTIRLMRRTMRRWEEPVHELRRELQLAESRQVMTFEGQFSPLGTLALFDAVLATPQVDWPPNLWPCGAALHDGRVADPVVAGELRRFLDEGSAPIAFALGSAAVNIAGDYWREAIAATQAIGRRAILLTGKPIANVLPATVKAFDYLPYSLVFPHAAVVVHQVGIGTLSQALRAGRPQLFTPVSFDQPDNALRAQRLGVGRVLRFGKATAPRLARELAAVLEDSRYAAAAVRVADELRGVDGAGVAADHIAALLN